MAGCDCSGRPSNPKFDSTYLCQKCGQLWAWFGFWAKIG